MQAESIQSAGETDEQLMDFFARGSADAFDRLFQRYRNPVFGFFRRRIADPAQAEELTQETFLAVIRARGRYQATALFRTYLYGIAFRVLHAYRRKAIFRAVFTGSMPAHSEPSEDSHLESELILRTTIAQLERIDREILLLREFEELSYAEIAQLLRIPVNTVRSRLFRARMALREHLATPVQPNNSGLSNVEEHA